MTNLLTVAVFPTRIEAELARGALEAAGIYSLIGSDDAGQQNPGLAYSSGATVLVRDDDLDAARQALHEASGLRLKPGS